MKQKCLDLRLVSTTELVGIRRAPYFTRGRICVVSWLIALGYLLSFLAMILRLILCLNSIRTLM